MSRLRVLLVEDVENDAILVISELSRAYDVVSLRVDSLEELRRALQEQVWDLLLSDFSLPRLGAMTVLQELAASGLDLPCIVISGTIEEEAAVSVMRAG